MIADRLSFLSDAGLSSQFDDYARRVRAGERPVSPGRCLTGLGDRSETLTPAPKAHKLGQNSDQKSMGRVSMKTMPLSEVKTKLSELVDAVERRDEVVTITRNGKPVAIIVSKDEYEGWHETVEIMRDKKFLEEIRRGIRSLKRTKKRYSLDDLFAD